LLEEPENVDRRHEDDRHDRGVVVRGDPPVIHVRGDESQQQVRDSHQHKRRPQREEQRRQKEQYERGLLGPEVSDEQVQQARDQRPVRVNRHGTQKPVSVAGIEVRDDHGHRQERPEQAPRRQGEPEDLFPVNGSYQQADGGHRDSLVLLHEDKGQRPERRGSRHVPDKGRHGECEQWHRERHFMKFVPSHFLEGPGKTVGDRHRLAWPTAQQFSGSPADRNDRYGDPPGSARRERRSGDT